MTKKTLEQLAREDTDVKDFLLEKAKVVKDDTLKLYRNKLGHIIKEANKGLLEVSREEAEQLATKVSKRGDGDLIGRIAGMFYRFHDKPEIAEAFKIPRKKRRLEPEQILTLDEVEKMIEVASSLRDRALIGLLWDTGCRIHEALALNLEHISKFENGDKTFLKVFFKKVKVEGEEHSPLLIEATVHVQPWFDSHPQKLPESPLFVSSGTVVKRLTYSGASHVLKRLLKAAGIKKRVSLHTFRHSRATYFLKLGVSEANIKKSLGWVPNSQMLARYSHLVDSNVDDSLLQLHGYEPTRKKARGLSQATEDLPPVKPMVFEEIHMGEMIEKRIRSEMTKELIEIEKAFEKRLEELFERNWVMPKNPSLVPLWLPVEIDSENAVGKCAKCNVGYTEVHKRQFSECRICGDPIQWDDIGD